MGVYVGPPSNDYYSYGAPDYPRVYRSAPNYYNEDDDDGAVFGYALYYWRKRYPRESSAYEEAVRRRRWMPTPRKRAAVRRR